MFSSPSVRVFPSNENVDNMVQRKQGDTNHLLSRKPFIDRSVNSKTPDINRSAISAKDRLNFMKGAIGSLKKSANSSTLTNIPIGSPRVEDLDAEDFIYSGKQNYDDWYSIDISKIVNVLRCYIPIEDSHPRLIDNDPEEIDTIDVDPIDIDPMFFALPEPFGRVDPGMVELPAYGDVDSDLP